MSIDITKRVQKYVNHHTLREALDSDRYDMVQVKYDGWWARVEVNAEPGKAHVYSRQGQLKETFKVSESIGRSTLIGEFLRGTNRSSGGASVSDSEKDVVMVFDVIADESSDHLMSWSYSERLSFLHHVKHDTLPGFCRIVPTHAIVAARKLWAEHVIEGNAEGLVFRSSLDTYAASVIGRMKRQFTTDYIALEVIEGKGKRKGMVGALVGGMYVNGELRQCCRVGGGFSDSLGSEIFSNFENYRGRVFEAKGWQFFESTGALRHPNFVRWRDDKRPDECVLDIP